MARVLIVDDSAVARRSLREIVLSLGHTVVGEVPSGSQAFVEYNKLKPDVVTMDLTMQGLGGLEATSKIISAYPEAKIIVISAMEERRVVIDTLERGARHFIIKPISKEKVAIVLKNVLQQDVDLKQHMKRVKQLKGMDDPTNSVNSGANQHIPPYFISVQAGNLVHIFINSSISLTSCQSLEIEMDEHLIEKPRVLLDFGAMAVIDKAIVVRLNEMIEIIENSYGIVKAISSNKRFVEGIAAMELGNKANLISEVLRYIAN